MPGGLQIDAKPWTPEEDHVILDMHAADGPKWSQIVQALPGRTISSVRNRWQRLEKGRKLREAGLESRNRCHACGQPKRGHICYAKARGGPQVEIVNPMLKHSLDAPYPPALNAPTLNGPTRSSKRHAARTSQPDFLPTLTSLDFLDALPSQEDDTMADDSSASVSASPVTVAAEPPAVLTVDLGVIQPPMPAAKRQKVSFSFNVAEPPAAAEVPPLARSNTSFFNALADSAVFTPSSKAILESWANDSGEPPALFKENSFSQLAPPPLVKDISLSSLAPPMPTLQRSLDSFSAVWPSESPAMVRLMA